MDHLPIRSSLLFLRCLLLASAAACVQPAPGAADHLRERIVLLEPDASGGATVEFELSQRRFRIDPARPGAAEMLASAKRALASGTPVDAEVAPNPICTKGENGPPFVLVRLVEAPRDR